MCSTHLYPFLVDANNLLPANERVELLATPPAVLHTTVLVRVLRADLALRQPPLLASVDCAHGDLFSRTEGAAHVSAFRNAAAWADVACGEAWEAGHAGDAADVPDFELLVPFCGGGAGKEDCQDGEEGEESNLELHCSLWCWFFGAFDFRLLEDLLLDNFDFAERTGVAVRMEI